MHCLHRRESAGFSLMEVVIATGVFAFAIVAVIGLMGTPSRSAREVIDSDVAARLAEATDEQLKDFVRLATNGFDDLDDATAPGELVVYATVDGSRIQLEQRAEEPAPPAEGATATAAEDIPVGEQYFLLEISQLVSPPPAPDPKPYLALQVRVQWPYKLPDGTEAQATQRSSFSFNTAIRR